MAFDLKQSLKLTQGLLMTPQLQQAIKLLQLSRMELEQFVESQLSENPILEESQNEASSEEIAQAEKERESTANDAISDQMAEQVSQLVDRVPTQEKRADEVDWESFVPKDESGPAAKTNNNFDDDQPNYENLITRGETLQEHLTKQCGEVELDAAEKQIATVIIGNIDEKGYLSQSLTEIAQQEKVELEFAEDVLDVIQRFDPPGVGARDLKECLLNQLRFRSLRNGIVEKIVENHLDDLQNRNYPHIAKVLKLTIDQVIENVAIIADLDPIPGRQYGGEATQFVIPDVYVFKMGGEWVVSMNEEGLPRLRVSAFYRDMMKGKQAKGKDKEYLQDKYKSAQWLIKSLQQRQSTIFKVTEKIVEKQKDFFDQGVQHLKPMILRDIADSISMHESTISRVTSNKYVHTPRGIFELKYFFNSSIATSDGESVASESVKRMIEEVVKAEDDKKPLSDQQIVEILEKKGVHLARRTVAKYREQLNILPSSKRKKLY